MNKYTIIEADVTNNEKDILSILISNLNGQSQERYLWNYKKCPYGDAKCWLTKEEISNTFVGSGALFSRKILIKGHKVYVGIAGDFVIEKKHRSLGPALKLQKTIQESIERNNLSFIYGIPNKLSEMLFLKIGYKKVGEFKRFVKIIKAEYKTKKNLQPSFLTKLFSEVINFIIKFVSKETNYKKSLNYSIEMPNYFDGRFDRLWEKIPKESKIIGERTSEFLNWRYKHSPDKFYKIFCLVGLEENILGYIIYHILENMCYISDISFIASEGVLDSLLAEFSLFSRRSGFGSISILCLDNEMFEKKFKEFNFFIKKEDSENLIVYTQDSALKNDLLDKQKWHFFSGDNDV